jgi:hypothetical protein
MRFFSATLFELSFQNSLSLKQLSHVDSFSRLISYKGRTTFPELSMSAAPYSVSAQQNLFDRSGLHLEI